MAVYLRRIPRRRSRRTSYESADQTGKSSVSLRDPTRRWHSRPWWVALPVDTRLSRSRIYSASIIPITIARRPSGDPAFGSTRSTPWRSRPITANPPRSPSRTITPVSVPASALVSARQRFGGATQIEETVRGRATSKGLALETRPDVPRGHLRIRFASQAVHPDQGRIGPCDARTTTLPGERLAIHRCQAPSATSRSFQTRTVPTIVVSLAR